MIFIYPSFPLNNKIVDPDYQNEYESALRNGSQIYLISIEDLIDGNVSKAIKNVSNQSSNHNAIFRGWMLNPEIYSNLYNELKSKNILLINNPSEYIFCHYFPNSYNVIKEKTAKSIFFDFNNDLDYELLISKLSIFNGKPILVKDFVKSQKHKWNDACFIKSSSDLEEVKRVTDNFIKLQGSSLNKGLVFREFLELEFIGEHSKSKMPLTKEYRLFFFKGELIGKYNYWDEGKYISDDFSIDEFSQIVKSIKSNFFTMDIAKTINGDWKIIEIGDGQVSGLPDNADIELFYKGII